MAHDMGPDSAVVIIGIFISLLIVVGLVAVYFGVFNVDGPPSERCTFEAGIRCDDILLSAYNDSHFDLKIQLLNAFGEDINITNMSVQFIGSEMDCSADHPNRPGLISNENTVAFHAGEYIVLNFSSAIDPVFCISPGEFDMRPGKKQRIEMKLMYVDNTSGFSHTLYGEAYIKSVGYAQPK